MAPGIAVSSFFALVAVFWRWFDNSEHRFSSFLGLLVIRRFGINSQLAVRLRLKLKELENVACITENPWI